MSNTSRPTLGPLMNMVCFQYLRVGTEDVAGRAPIIAAGSKRGYDLVESLGLLGSTIDAASMKQKLDAALGMDGTRLCLLQDVTPKANGGYEFRLTETACTAGQHSDVPLCAFTLGVFIGAVYAMTGVRMVGTETACAACGNAECVYQIDPV